MKKNNFLHCALAFLGLSVIHFFWISSTVKWTQPIVYFLSFTACVLIFFVFLYRWYKNWSALWLTVFGLGVGYLASTFAWVVADLMYAPERVQIFIAKYSVLFLFKEAIFVSFITGGSVVATLGVWMPRFFIMVTK
jgi:hypothetical protein